MFTRRGTREVFRAGLLSLLVAAGAFAQSGSSVTSSIPFEFSLGQKAVPAGTYRFSVRPAQRQLVITDASGTDMYLPILTRLSSKGEFQDAGLVFDTTGDNHVLSEVWIPGQDGILVSSTPEGHEHQSVIAVVSGASSNQNGKAIFAESCGKCHGPDGGGNAAADKFFQLEIPRLNSDYVQSKSDMELREIITNGRRNMPPVRVGQPTVQHLLQPQAVDAVISFVRTLKTS